MPWQEGVSNTPLPEYGKSEFLDGLVQDARAHGARIVNPSGGQSDHSIYLPTLLYPVIPTMRLYHEEQFGPLVALSPYPSPKYLLQELANSPFGQGISIFGRDHTEMSKLATQLRNLSTRINFNSQCQRGPDILPFGARRSSGLGTLSISDALRAFSVETVLARPR